MTAFPAPTPPWTARQRLRYRWARRRAAAWLARQLRRLERHLDPLPRDPHRPTAAHARAVASGHPCVVPDTPPSIASGRADLQLVHGHRTPHPDAPITDPSAWHDTEHQGNP